jgi:hypothetical protein
MRQRFPMRSDQQRDVVLPWKLQFSAAQSQQRIAGQPLRLPADSMSRAC